MSTTNLTAKLKMVVQGQDKIEKMVRNINKAQQSVRDAGDQAGYFARKIVQATDKVNRLSGATKEVANSAKKATNEYSKLDKVISGIGSKLKRLAGTYLGIMGMGALVNNTDTYISAQNKLNALPGGSPELTNEAMDKMYGAAQRSRTGYADMIANVSKSMTLAGKSFDGNIDNAIKFQEIMGKTYSLGGASANEQSQSMYQLIQSLGAGRLQGDELRSMLEGAPLAAAEIEKFAQKVYGTTESIKELGSQGKITSDLVVAAILNSEQKISEAFENTAMTYAQAWTMIKNTAFQSFRPVFEMLKNALKSDFGKSVINGIGIALQVVAKALTTVFSLIGKVYNFVVDNWGVISKVILTLGTLIGAYFVYNLSLALSATITLIAKLILGFVLAAGAAVKAGAAAFVSWMTTCLPLFLVIAILAAIVIAIIWVADSFRDACGIIVGLVYAVYAAIVNVIFMIINVALAMWNALNAICENIGIAFCNAWYQAEVKFWEWVQSCLNGTGLIAKAVSKIAKAFGLDSVSIDTKIDKAKGKIQDYVDIEGAFNEGLNIIPLYDVGEMYNKGYAKGTSFYDWGSNKLDEFKEKLGLDGLGDGYDKLLGTGSYDPSNIAKGIGDTANNTGKMADAMDLAEEDLEYLRKIADMEWRKEFTTAEIKVDMSNYNTVNGDSDLDGIVTKLSQKLYEELDMVANGVYA